VIVCGAGDEPLRDGGGLRDIAPTVLDAMGIPVPTAMTGRSLLSR
jgi:2,3-bisphosphoglycerate-independent phosphoglycerate mutase